MARKESERDRLLKDMKEAGNQPTGIRGWLKNVFTYHYLKPTILAIIAVVMISLFVYDLVRDKSYDSVLTVIARNYANTDGVDAAYTILSRTPGDSNGNGKLDIYIDDYAVAVAASTESDTAHKIETLQVNFASNPEAVLYVIHKDFREYFEPETSYRFLSELGIESDDPYFVSAAGCEAVDLMFPQESSEDFYFAFKTCPISKREEPEYIRYYELAVEAYYALTAGE